MDRAPGVLIANQKVLRSRPVPRLRLLIEWEPRHRVFFGNLADLLLSRRVPQVAITSRPARFWNDVFVPSGAPWTTFMESILLQLLLVILFVWSQSRVWESVKLFPQKDSAHRAITYYPPAPSFRAAEGRAPSARAQSRMKHASPRQPAHQPAMPVTPERKPSIVTPPDLKQVMAKPPNFPDSHAVTPMAPFPATVGQHRPSLAGPSGVVAPSPRLDQAATRRSALPQASAVAPAPEVGGTPAERALKAPSTAVVPPPPSVQSADNSARAGRLSSVPGAGPNVVPPPPSVQGAHNARLSSIPGAGSQVVPPAPIVQNGGNSERAQQLHSLPGARPNVVLPPPSVQGVGNGAGTRVGSMASGSQVVPPPPSVQGAGRVGRLGSMADAGTNVVSPPPLVQGVGNSADARLGSLPGTGSQVVPPPPLMQGSGASDGGARLGSLAGAGSEVMPPTPSFGGTGNPAGSGTGKMLEPMDPLPGGEASAIPALVNDDKSTFEDLPLGLIGVVFAPPGTSFFSNFEVFVVKRKVSKDQLQLIKLVYEFLPYQRRLSEYDLNNTPARVIKLRVIPDPSCDESLGQMIHMDPTSPAAESQKLPAALRSADPNAVLPCYRTTAGDFQKAMLRGH